ncbi:MAG TPA: hypothetical protein VJ965_07170 [Anaerolineales bacterium]|nr:hypothetical protein [Anaerolineales bacterium]
MTDDARAKLKLADDREVWRDGSGRYRDCATGKWVARETVEESAPVPAPLNLWLPEKESPVHSAMGEAEKRIMEAVQAMGLEAASIEEAVAHLLAVQAEIALDKDNGAKATSAVRLIGQYTGMLGKRSEDEKTDEDPQPWFILGRDLAQQILTLVEKEQARRA